MMNKKGQVTPEYSFVLILAVAVLTAMAVYVQRSLQARMNDTKNYMADSINKEANLGGKFKVQDEYEPYYADVDSTVVRDNIETTDLDADAQGRNTGVVVRTINSTTKVNATQKQLPPR